MSVSERFPARFAIKIPMPVALQLGPEAEEVKAEVRDMSAHGIFFFLSPPPAVGTEFSFTITLSEEITLTEDIRIRCKGRVTRVEVPGPGQPPCVSASIESYDSAIAAGDQS